MKTKDFEKFTNMILNKVSINIENFSYNVIVANLYETYNFLIKNLDLIYKDKIIVDNYKKILTVFSPVIPHIINECLDDLKINNNLIWPEIDNSLIEKENVNIVVQINGKKRDLLKLNKKHNEKEILEKALKSKKCIKYLEKKEIKKTIYVKNKLINIII